MKQSIKVEEIPASNVEEGDYDAEAERVRQRLGWPKREPQPQEPDKVAA